MLIIESTVTPSFEQWSAIIDGTRNPMNSWAMMDSYNSCFDCEKKETEECSCEKEDQMVLGTSDLNLLARLASAGNVNASHSKYRRMIPVYVTVTAPLYWWKEFDTYKVGTVRNSCSTMHKITEKEFTLDDFSWERLYDNICCSVEGDIHESYPIDCMKSVIYTLNCIRSVYLNNDRKIVTLVKEVNSLSSDMPCNIYEDPRCDELCRKQEKIRELRRLNKDVWYNLIQLLPSSYNQKSTLFLNYEVLHKIYVDRKGHKLDEWHTFCNWIKTLPYSELIIGEDD